MTIPDFFTKYLGRSKEGKKILAEITEDLKEEEAAPRTAAAHSIQDARLALERELPALAAAEAAARQRYREAQARLKEADAALQQAYRTRVARIGVLQRAILRSEGILRQAADPAIAALIHEIQEVEAHSMKHYRRWVVEERQSWYGSQQFVQSNYGAIEAQNAACRSAREAAEALKLEVGIDVQQRLKEIRATIPALEVLEEKPV